jgi:metal-responsive CopG/Arc/MetJ family transcriptional regulator
MKTTTEQRILNVSLPEAVIEQIDRRAQDELISRAAWMRRVLALAVRSASKDTVAA